MISSALDIGDGAQGRGRLHEMRNQREAAASVVELHMVASRPPMCVTCIAQALSPFAGSRPRPAYLEMPLDLLKQPAGPGWVTRGLPSRPVASIDACKKAARLLASASNPLMIIGGGAMDAAAPRQSASPKGSAFPSSPRSPPRAWCAPTIRSALAPACRMSFLVAAWRHAGAKAERMVGAHHALGGNRGEDGNAEPSRRCRLPRLLRHPWRHRR